MFDDTDRQLIGQFMGRVITMISRNFSKQDEQFRIDILHLIDLREEFENRPDLTGNRKDA